MLFLTPPSQIKSLEKLGGLFRGLYLILIVSPAVLMAQPGGIRGVVRDSAGGVVGNARVTLSGVLAAQVTTDSTGEFHFTAVPDGIGYLEVRRLGYRPASRSVTVPRGSEIHLDVEMAPIVAQLTRVQVTGRAQPYDSRLAGFNERKSKHIGYIVTRDKLDRMSSARFVDALREMPGLSVRSMRNGGVTISLRGARCSPMFYMDGFPASSGAMDLDMIDLAGVEGIEVYAGMSSTPPEFLTVRGTESCGVIAVWSRPFRPKPRVQNQMSVRDIERLITEHTVFTADEVSDPVTFAVGTIRPIYPDSLRAAGILGRVVAEFIVGLDGRIETGSVIIASATHPDFATAVRLALQDATFNPALLKGAPVRQLVRLPFDFKARDDTSAVSH
jgi:TonB family protein